MAEPIRIGALISGGGTNLQAIIDACKSGGIAGRMAFVGTDNPEAKGLARAEKSGIPSFIVDYGRIIRSHRENPGAAKPPADFRMAEIREKQHLVSKDPNDPKAAAFLTTRAIAEAALLAEMAQRPFDLLVLAGFMRNLTPYFIDRVNTDPKRPRIMNIHPALLPAFPGVDGYGDTYRYGCKVGGCTVHFIDYGEDSGPIIGQRCFPIEPSDTLSVIKKKGLGEEWRLYPECIELFARGRLTAEERTHPMPGGRAYRRTVVRIG